MATAVQYSDMKTVVFFDIDGTLLRSGGAGKLAMMTAVQEAFGVAPTPVEVPFSGRTDRAIMRDLLHAHKIEFTSDNFHRLVETYLQLLPECLQRMTGRVLPGVLELLQALERLDHVAVGLLTGNLRRGAQTKLGYFGLAERFPFGGFGDVHFDRNSVARDALAAAQCFLNGSCAPERIWVIGDTPLDIECARHIGARVLAVATGTHTLEQLAAHQPDLLLSDLRQYELLLERL
ncbi:MAG: haloacid dehalogenase-like hydrolase [Gemmatales bacterium]|nr:haloacid dehalogenase-like hydrolase [Gemmatales bacterium]MDW8174587.1 haloacid dehalogenase-like hydrolase [Gemmatales bacterium]